MTDKDVVERAATICNVNLLGPYSRGGDDSKPCWKLRWRMTVGGEDAARLMRMLRPHMGERRQQAIDNALTAWDNHPKTWHKRRGLVQ